MAIQGCFKTTSFDINYWHLIFANNPFYFSFPSLLLFRTILQHPLPKKCTLFSAGQLSKKSFFLLFPLLQFFIFLNEPCHLFISKELNHPANPCHVVPLVLLGEREINITCLWLSLWIHQLSNPNSIYLNFRIC
jgi:hypothetical protein